MEIDTRPDGRSQNPSPRKFRAIVYLSPLAKRAFAPSSTSYGEAATSTFFTLIGEERLREF